MISTSSLDSLEQELLPHQNIRQTEATFSSFPGMNSIFIVLRDNLESGRNSFLPIPQTIHFDLAFLGIFSVQLSEDTMKRETPTFSLFFLVVFFFVSHFCSSFVSQPPWFQFQSFCPELPALLFTVAFSTKLDSLKISVITKDLTS